jgi:hypothetical protein
MKKIVVTAKLCAVIFVLVSIVSCTNTPKNLDKTVALEESISKGKVMRGPILKHFDISDRSMPIEDHCVFIHFADTYSFISKINDKSGSSLGVHALYQYDMTLLPSGEYTFVIDYSSTYLRTVSSATVTIKTTLQAGGHYCLIGGPNAKGQVEYSIRDLSRVETVLVAPRNFTIYSMDSVAVSSQAIISGINVQLQKIKTLYPKVSVGSSNKTTTILEGNWIEGLELMNCTFNFTGNTFMQFAIGKHGESVPLFRGVFRIRDGNLELIMKSLNSNYQKGIENNANPVWKDDASITTPTWIYSMNLQGNTLILETIGGDAYEGKEDSRKITLIRY